jgi:hypothetical protein
MTEVEWLNCTDPGPMLDFLRSGGKLSDRKLRLLAVACCRRIWHLLVDERSRKAVEVAECFADGMVSEEECDAAQDAALEASDDTQEDDPTGEKYMELEQTAAPDAAAGTVGSDPAAVVPGARWAILYEFGHTWGAPIPVALQQLDAAEKMAQVALLRELFGNPFRPIAAPRGSRISSVTTLAQAIYDERRFGDLAILADALEEAGCDNAEILAHCRGPGQHLRGCWAIDLILGKE